MEQIDAFPLQWPVGYNRTINREKSRFTQTMENSQRFLRNEVSRLGGRHLIVSTNIPVRRDGGLYSDYMNRKIDDPGAAIYFKYNGKDISMCCDKYNKVWENIYALGKAIEALRGMERWGVSNFLERAFTGFAALPEQREENIWDILGLSTKPNNPDAVKEAYRVAVKKAHPDTGGTDAKFLQVQEAYRKALSFYN